MHFELDQFIFKFKDSPDRDSKFIKISKHAHKSHYEVHRRYKKFLKFNRDLGDNLINKRRAEKCCKMVKKHVNELKIIQKYLHDTGYDVKHPIFYNKISIWVDECNRVYLRYKARVDSLPT